MSIESHGFSCKGPMKKMLALVFIFGASIFLFQYLGVYNYDENININPSLNPDQSPLVDDITIKVDDPPSQQWQLESDSNVHLKETDDTLRESPSITSSSSSSSVDKISSPSPPPPPPPPPMPEIPTKFSERRIYSFREIAEMFFKGHQSAHSKVPLWSSKVDKELVYAKSEIEKAGHTDDSPSEDGDDELYAPVYHNFTMFKRSYELMEKTLKVYIYEDGDKPIFHQPILEGTYAAEGWFMKLLESNKHFVTKNPEKAHLFYIPFSSQWLRMKIPNSVHKKSYVQFLKTYLDKIVTKYPYWNRTGGADHFFAACHDWSEFITRDIMSTCIRAVCDADIYKSFKFGKDISLPTTRIYTGKNPLLNVGGDPPSQRKTLAFFAGQMHGYLRPILVHHWENSDPDIKVFGGSTRVNGSEAYVSYMRGSKYCICPRGFQAFGPRFMEAIYYECVPVLISDNYIPPFSDILDWESFSVFVTENDIPRLKEVLESIPEEVYLSLHARVKMVQRHFLWHHKPVKYDAFHMVLHSVWYNRVLQFLPKEMVK